jgi:hypothetical protein
LRRIKRGRGREEKPREGKTSTNRWKGRGVYILGWWTGPSKENSLGVGSSN